MCDIFFRLSMLPKEKEGCIGDQRETALKKAMQQMLVQQMAGFWSAEPELAMHAVLNCQTPLV
jgi:hypothetical protein